MYYYHRDKDNTLSAPSNVSTILIFFSGLITDLVHRVAQQKQMMSHPGMGGKKNFKLIQLKLRLFFVSNQ